MDFASAIALALTSLVRRREDAEEGRNRGDRSKFRDTPVSPGVGEAGVVSKSHGESHIEATVG